MPSDEQLPGSPATGNWPNAGARRTEHLQGMRNQPPAPSPRSLPPNPHRQLHSMSLNGGQLGGAQPRSGTGECMRAINTGRPAETSVGATTGALATDAATRLRAPVSSSLPARCPARLAGHAPSPLDDPPRQTSAGGGPVLIVGLALQTLPACAARSHEALVAACAWLPGSRSSRWAPPPPGSGFQQLCWQQRSPPADVGLQGMRCQPRACGPPQRAASFPALRIAARPLGRPHHATSPNPTQPAGRQPATHPPTHPPCP